MSITNWEESLKRAIFEELDSASIGQYQVFLFGSQAQGTASLVSDIDIGIQGEKPLSFFIISNLRERVDALNIPFKVDIVDFKTVSEEFYSHAIKGAILWKN